MPRLKAAEHYDGKFLVHGNDDTLSAEDMALGYKQMIRVEQAWRDMKSTLDMRPVFHWAPHRIHAHVAITVLSLLLERTVEHACGDTWRNAIVEPSAKGKPHRYTAFRRHAGNALRCADLRGRHLELSKQVRAESGAPERAFPDQGAKRSRSSGCGERRDQPRRLCVRAAFTGSQTAGR
jgi:hypothetical protein